MDSYVIYNARYGILICREHEYAIKPSFIERHFRNEHQSTPLKIRRQIVEHAKTLPLVNPEDMMAPTDIPSHIVGLSIHDGFQCKNCDYNTVSLEWMERHCRDNHGWVKGGGINWNECKVQTMFTGKFIKYVAWLTRLMLGTLWSERQMLKTWQLN